jgi:GntR family transcriptional regulator/MocR family aminotransferase
MPRTTSQSSDWSTFGRDLLVSVSKTPRGQWGFALTEQLRKAVRSGALHGGMRLPSTRTLAADLAVSRGVVVGVYEQLIAEGYLESRPGSGTVVADVPKPTAIDPIERAQRPSPVRHNPGLPDVGLFPRRAWLRAYRRALEALPDADLRYGHPQGYEPLRAELAAYLGRVRGLRAVTGDILILNGFAQGFALLARLLPERGVDAIAVEDPGSTGAREQFRDWGMATPPVAVDEHGLVVDQLDRSGARAVLVTPAHHYPTGVVLAPERRHQLLDWVRAADGRFIIEDDYDAEYRYDSSPVGSLQPFDPERVITGSSISKTLAPGLRLGWLVLPPALIEAAVRLKAAFDLGTGVLTQAAFAELLASGDFDRHLRSSRVHYRRHRGHLARRLSAASPHLRVSGLDAGLSLCVYLGVTDDVALAGRLKRRGVTCEALSYYSQLPGAARGLVLDLAATGDGEMDLVIEALAAERGQ